MNYLNNLLFGYLPYIAVTAFFVGVLYHLFISDKTIHATSTLFLKKDKWIMWGSPMFHYGIILVFFGHVLGLFTPPALIEVFMPLATKRILAISIGFTAGLIAFIGLCMLLLRKFTDIRVKRTSSFADYFIVVLILAQIAMGLLSTYYTSQASLENYLSLDYWAQGMAWFQPDAWQHISTIDLIYKLHIVNGFFIFIIFPYTKLMHMIKVPVMYLIRPNRVLDE